MAHQPIRDAQTGLSAHATHDSWKGILVCSVASLFFFYEFFQMNMISAMSAALRQSFMITATQLSELSATYFVANAALIPFAGMILDRYSSRACILWSLGLCVIGVFGFSYAPTLGVAQWARLLTGVGGGFCFLSCMRLATLWFHERHLALVTGLIVSVGMLGGVVAQTPLTYLVAHSGWRMATLVDAGVGVVILFLVFLFVEDPRACINRSAHLKIHLPFWQSVRQSFLRWDNWCAGLYAGLLNLPVIILGGLVGITYLVRDAHVGQQMASEVTSALFFGMLLGSPCMGAVSDYFDQRRWVMAGGAAAALLIMGLIVWVHTWHVGTLGCLFAALGFVAGAQVIAYPTVAENNPPDLAASSVSVVSMSCIGLGALFEPVFGRLLDWHWAKHPPVMHGAHTRLYTAGDYHFAASSLLVAVALSLLLALAIRLRDDRLAE